MRHESSGSARHARLIDLACILLLSPPLLKIRGNPRITRVGRWLRRFSLDGLPQLFNVLKGEMSLVGPGPEETHVVQMHEGWHRKRLAVKPGLNGPMQINGRGDLSLDERVELELAYIEELCGQTS